MECEMPIKIVFTRKRVVPLDVDPFDTTVAVVHQGIHRRVVHALVKAPAEHRVVTFLAFVVVWAVLEYVLHYEGAAHGVEVFGVAPFADRVIKALFGD
jgi:hypothetical protein